MLTLGVLSGTSVDAIDLALVDWSTPSPQLVAYAEWPWSAVLQQQLLELPNRASLSLSEIGALNVACGEVFAAAIVGFLSRCDMPVSRIAAIGSHGQTIWHQPTGEYPFSWQLGHPAIIAKRTGIVTAADFRMDDMALRGQGAPFAPIFHQQFFARADACVGVLNLGGIANITILTPEGGVMGFDTGPANTLLDAWYRLHHHYARFDRDGAWAASVEPDVALVAKWMRHPYFYLPPPKSTGRELFSQAWLDHATLADYPPEVVQSSLLQWTVVSIVQALEQTQMPEQLWLCGGGAYNGELVRRLQQALPQCDLRRSDEAGYPAHALEAMLFAWLAKQRLTEQSIDLTAITGSIRPFVCGGLWLP
jgi:anhydro-N-acetylmuramic acid kinase